MRAFQPLALSAAVLVASSVSACRRPDPPQLTPKEVRVLAVNPKGIDLLVVIEATNPNSIALSAQSVTAKVKLDGKWELGAVTISRPIVLPASARTVIDAPMTVPWADMKTLTTLALAQKPVPYVVDGTVTVGGSSLNVDLPFSLSGTLTPEQLGAAALKGLPSIPGLRLP